MGATIERVVTYVVDYPIAGYFKFFRGLTSRRCVVVKLSDDQGRVGWGQAVPSPTWSYETIESVQTTIDGYLAPALMGLDVRDRAGIQRVLDRTIAPSFSTGQPIAKAGIDLALFDLVGKIEQKTAAERWGRSGRPAITLSWTVNVQELAELEDTVVAARERGFQHFNVKVGIDATLDFAICQRLRQLAPDAFIWADANGGYDLLTALEVAPRLADVGVAALEQPLPANRLSALRRLRQQGALPVILDEPLVSRIDLEEFHALGLLDGVAMKVARCGGLTEAQRMMEFIEREGLLLFASGLTDPDAALAASLLLFGAYDLSRPAALNASQYLRGSFLTEPLRQEGDQAWLPTGPGLGVEFDLSGEGFTTESQRTQRSQKEV